MTRDEVVARHREHAECWANKCKNPAWAAKHLERADAVQSGADLTQSEETGNDAGMMLDCKPF